MIAWLVFLLGATIAIYIFLYLNFTEAYWRLNDAITELPTGKIVILRSCLAMFMHFIIDKDIRQGLALMRYALNHPWHFRSWCSAFLTGFVQLALAIMAEYVSIHIILSTETYLDAVKDFIALIVVNEFDNHFFSYHNKEDIYKLIVAGSIDVGGISLSLADLLRIETTTSFKPDREEDDPEPGPVLEPIYFHESEVDGQAAANSSSPYPEKTCCAGGRPTSAILRFSDRTFFSKFGRIIYLLLKISYMSYWFYWGGYIVPLASYAYPLYARKAMEAKIDTFDEFMMSGEAGKLSAKDDRGYTF